MRLSINLVTRGRPERMIEAVMRTLPLIKSKATRLVISADDDDQQTIDALKALPIDRRIVHDIRVREDSLGAKYNRILDYPADVYMSMADYGSHCTRGFDKVICNAAALFPDNIGVVFGHMANASFSQIYGVTHGLVEKMGWLYPPYFPYWFVDHWVHDIARMIDRVAFADVQVDYQNKPPTQELREVRFWATLYDMHRLTRRECAHKIIRSRGFQEPTWRKRLLLKAHPIAEFWSQGINDYLRAHAAFMEANMNAGPGGDRYDRLKIKGESMMRDLAPRMLAELGAAA
jgi:hypothetical protein